MTRHAAPRGILTPEHARPFRLVESAAAEDLSEFVEKYWIVIWDLRGAPAYRQATLPHPAVHLVF